MFQFRKCHIIKASCFLRRCGWRCHFGVVFQVGGESERAFFAFFTLAFRKHTIKPVPTPFCRRDTEKEKKETAETLSRAKQANQKIVLRKFTALAGIDPTNLNKTIAGKRRPSLATLAKLQSALMKLND